MYLQLQLGVTHEHQHPLTISNPQAMQFTASMALLDIPSHRDTTEHLQWEMKSALPQRARTSKSFILVLSVLQVNRTFPRLSSPENTVGFK